MTKQIKHFLTLDDFSASELADLIAHAIDLKQRFKSGETYEPLRGKTLAMIFSKSSTRTRVSFETGMRQLGGGAINLTNQETQIGRGEPIEDTARVVSSMVDAIMIRTAAHADVETMAAFSSVPVINGLTDDYHPCQLLADVQTFVELKGSISGATVAWIGDGNNVCHSFMNAARLFNFKLRIATPESYKPSSNVAEKNKDSIELGNDPRWAVADADLVVTDTWASMGQEEEKQTRANDFAPFQVTQELMQLAHREALFMHCLPAYRGMEVSAEVIDGPQSVVFAEAENRLHAQKALLNILMA
ncbi:MAG: ornithine carbamoyltransferase [Pseudomonadota bacterium]